MKRDDELDFLIESMEIEKAYLLKKIVKIDKEKGKLIQELIDRGENIYYERRQE